MIYNLINKDNKVLLIYISLGLIAAFFADDYLLYVASSWLIFGILGLSLDLLWGKVGILSLGQTIFYGLGGYAGSIFAINFIPYFGNTFLLVLPLSALVGALIAGIIGYFIFYGRMGELQVTILTYTLVLLVWTLSLSYSFTIGQAVVGGDNGLSNIPSFAFSNNWELNEKEMFLSVLFISSFLLLFCQKLMKTSFGKVIECIRQDSLKTELLGYDVRKYNTMTFIISGAIAGIGGGLFALWGNYLNPNMFSVSEALLVPIYVLLGGLGTLIGPFIGAIAIGSLSFFLGSFSGGQATLVIGIILILMVLFFDKGIVGIIISVRNFFTSEDKNEELIEIDINHYEDIKSSHSKRLSSKNVYKSFGGVIPVNDITLEFKPGKTSCIIGPNGAGKSSFLKVCAGIYTIKEGLVLLDNENISKHELHDRVQCGLGIKMQKAQVFKSFSIKDNIWIAAYSKTKNIKKADEICSNMLNMIGGKKHENKIADSLSHGEQQWLDIIMVLSLNPSVILLDEPAAGMTKSERNKLSSLINKIALNKTIILVEHDMDFIKSLNSNIVVLHHGKVFETGTFDEITKNEKVLDIYLGRK